MSAGQERKVLPNPTVRRFGWMLWGVFQGIVVGYVASCRLFSYRYPREQFEVAAVLLPAGAVLGALLGIAFESIARSCGWKCRSPGIWAWYFLAVIFLMAGLFAPVVIKARE